MVGLSSIHRVALHIFRSSLSTTFLFFGSVGARLTLICLSCRLHIGAIKLASLGIASLSLRLQTPLDQCCPYNAAFSTFACCAGFLQRVSMTGIICLLWVAFGLSAALLPGLHAHIHEQRNRPLSSLASSGLEGCWRIPKLK